ncbi:hypothetical protein BD779DRAFT_1445569, partial [Infundibulicybe gibba]
SLTRCDPSNIHETLAACVKRKICISVVTLAVEIKVFHGLYVRTGSGVFPVVFAPRLILHELQELVPPPAQRAASRATGPGTAP